MELKKKLITAHVLTLPNSNKPYVVYTDTSSSRLGRVIMQNCKVLTYVSHQLKSYEKNYPTYDLELAALTFVLKI